LKYETLKKVEVLSMFRLSRPSVQMSAPYWRLSGDGSVWDILEAPCTRYLHRWSHGYLRRNTTIRPETPPLGWSRAQDRP